MHGRGASMHGKALRRAANGPFIQLTVTSTRPRLDGHVHLSTVDVGVRFLLSTEALRTQKVTVSLPSNGDLRRSRGAL